MVTIYIQNKPLFLVNEISPEIDDYLHRPATLFLDELSPAAVRTMLEQMEASRFYYGVFKHKDVGALLAAFKAETEVVTAAGGLVHTPENDLLLIHRLGHWDLPKGKLDKGESLEACAIREIGEETGATGLHLEQPLHITYHTYHQNGNRKLKESHWFLIRATAQSPLTPQTEEGVMQCRWVPLSDISAYAGQAFASIAEVLQIGSQVLNTPVK